jgi:hypothetical protein
MLRKELYDIHQCIHRRDTILLLPSDCNTHDKNCQSLTCIIDATLNQHLHRIKRSATPNCPIWADSEETIHHFLFVCPQYDHERFILSPKLVAKLHPFHSY